MSEVIVSVIIVSHNSRRWIERQTLALADQRERRFEVIFWDNASRPEEEPDPASLPPEAHLVRHPENLGFAEANNRAARLAKGRFLAFLNPDAFPAADWLAALLAAAEEHPSAAAFGSTQWRADATGIMDGAGDVLHACGIAFRGGHGHRGPPPATGETFAGCAAALMVRREAFEAAGGFDPLYFCYFEDVDLCFRLRLLGHSIVQVREAEVAHVGGGSAGARSAFGEFHGARNRLWCFFKCMPLPLLIALAPFHFVATGLNAAQHLVSLRGTACLRGIWAGLWGLGPILRARRRVQHERRATTAAIARALTWDPRHLLTRRPVVWPVRSD